ncbi:MAG TPA: DUF1573 domain-containing protein [Gemmataceae bacterium]|nr:DUF1573 domain-containing protein [Gemmataceae bacterium]
MRRLILSVVLVGAVAQTGFAQQPILPAQPAPWANKFFLKDIEKNREQVPPPAIVHDFGDVPSGTLCVHKFTITNVYDTAMQITEVRKSCTCLDYVPMATVLQPNEDAEFTVTMNAGKFIGFNSQTFYITFGPKYVSTAVVRVQANSRTDVTVNPGAIGFGTVAQGTKMSQATVVKYTGRMRDWKIVEAAPHGPFEVQLTELNRGGPLRPGAEYRVDVTLKPTATAGPLNEQITLKTNDPTNPQIHVTVTGAVVAPLDLSHGKVRFDAIAVGQSGTQRVFVRAGKPFKIVGVEGAGDGISVELPAATAALPYQVLTIKFEPTKPGEVTKQLRVRTDLDGGAAVVLPVEGEAIK